MHAALFIDPDRLKWERDWFNRTVVGLVSAGVRVTRILPANEPDDERVALAPAVWYDNSGVPWTARQRHAELASELADARAPDVIHAMGRGIWADALDLARRIQRQVILDVWNAEECQEAIRFARKSEVAGLLAAGENVADMLRKRDIGRELIQVAPIGVYVPEQSDTSRKAARHTTNEMRGIVGIIAAGGARFEAIEPLLNAFAAVSNEYPNFMLFGDFRDRTADKVWRHLKNMNLLDHLSLIPPVQEHRELVLQSDLLLLPAPSRTNTSFLLQAMASPLATAAVRDPYVDILHEDTCACLLDDSADETAWKGALDVLLTQPARLDAVCRNARTWIAQHHGVSRQIEVLADSYDRIVTGGARPIG